MAARRDAWGSSLLGDATLDAPDIVLETSGEDVCALIEPLQQLTRDIELGHDSRLVLVVVPREFKLTLRNGFELTLRDGFDQSGSSAKTPDPFPRAV